MRHEEIREGALSLILKIMPDVQTLLGGKKIILQSGIVEEIEEFFDNLENYASPDLRSILHMIRSDLQNEKTLFTFGVRSQ